MSLRWENSILHDHNTASLRGDVADVINVNYSSSLTLSTPTTSFINTNNTWGTAPDHPYVRIFDVARRLFPYVTLDEGRARDVLRMAEDSVNSQFTILNAVEWAGGFVYPSDVGVRDSVDLERLGGTWKRWFVYDRPKSLIPG